MSANALSSSSFTAGPIAQVLAEMNNDARQTSVTAPFGTGLIRDLKALALAITDQPAGYVYAASFETAQEFCEAIDQATGAARESGEKLLLILDETDRTAHMHHSVVQRTLAELPEHVFTVFACHTM